MTNVSTKETDSKAFKGAENQLSTIISRLDRQSSSCLLNELLTDSERIMIIKRFGAIFLLHNRYSMYKTAQLLGLSQPTVQRCKDQYVSGNYDQILRLITTPEKNELLGLFVDFALSKGSIIARKNLIKRIL